MGKINENLSNRQLAVFGLSWLCFFALVGLKLRRHGHHEAGFILWAMAIFVPAGGLIWPRGLRAVYFGMTTLTRPVGSVVSKLTLAAVFFLAFAPIGVLFRIFSYDPLGRRFDREATSYWKGRTMTRTPESYFEQN